MIDVCAPLVGHVWQVLAVTGDTVTRGTAIAVLETMKMEIPVPAPADGRVELLVEEGALVHEGDVLARIFG